MVDRYDRYRWWTPGDWLAEKVGNTTDPHALRGMLYSLLDKLDSDTIQDVFQSDMEADGYFDPITTEEES